MGAKRKHDEDLRNDELLRDDLISEALEEAGLDVEGNTTDKARRLEVHYLALTKPVGWNTEKDGTWHLLCEIEKGGCGYSSTAHQTFCVFCGDGQEDQDSGVVPVKAEAGLVVHNKGGGEVVDAELIDEGEGLPKPDGEPRGTVADLDAAVAEVNAAMRALEDGERKVVGHEWDLGKKIFDIFRGSLYYARKKDTGAPLYSSWPQFCKAELRLSAASINRYMRIATNFTRELACDLGASKLVELLPAAQAQAADEDIAKRLGREPKVILAPLLARARVLPVADLRAEVRAAVPTRTAPVEGAKGTANATAAAAAKRLAAKKPEAERVTVQRQEGTVRLRFYLDEEAARAGDKKRAAKKFQDGIVAVEPAVNGVEVVHHLVMDGRAGGPVLVRKVVRLDG